MNPMVQAALGSVIRHVLTLAAGYLVSQGIWSEQDAAGYVAAASMVALSLAWSIWQKYGDRLKLLVGLTSPSGTTEAMVELKIAAGVAVPVATPKDALPMASIPTKE